MQLLLRIPEPPAHKKFCKYLLSRKPSDGNFDQAVNMILTKLEIQSAKAWERKVKFKMLNPFHGCGGRHFKDGNTKVIPRVETTFIPAERKLEPKREQGIGNHFHREKTLLNIFPQTDYCLLAVIIACLKKDPNVHNSQRLWATILLNNV